MNSIANASPGRIALGLCLLGCAGCGPAWPQFSLPTVGHDTREAVQEGVASETIVVQAMDAATQALMQDSIAAWSPRLGRSEAASAPIGSVRSGRLVDFAALTDPAGHPRFRHTSGTFTVHAEGQATPSWPLGATVLSIQQVTVVFDQGPVAFTDPLSKVTATIGSGSYRYDIEASYTVTADGWTLALDSEATVPRAAPLRVRIDRPHRDPRTVSLFGGRAAHLRLAREHDGDLDRLTAEMAYDGTGTDGATVVGAAGVDPRQPAATFTDWDLTVEGGGHVVWNRRLHAKAHWDYGASPCQRTGDEMTQEIVLTRDGEVSGPYSAVDLALLFHASAN